MPLDHDLALGIAFQCGGQFVERALGAGRDCRCSGGETDQVLARQLRDDARLAASLCHCNRQRLAEFCRCDPHGIFRSTLVGKFLRRGRALLCKISEMLRGRQVVLVVPRRLRLLQ